MVTFILTVAIKAIENLNYSHYINVISVRHQMSLVVSDLFFHVKQPLAIWFFKYISSLSHNRSELKIYSIR
ncbi:hypothetical protein PPBDW_II1350 [Photobacterium kishitanii]|nr:hypothetical protein PPBDW_II1350 [Photobacterium kishitanii]